MEPTAQFVASFPSDSGYDSARENRRRVSGETMFLFDTVIFVFSWMQKCVILSVTEAEFVCSGGGRQKNVVCQSCH
jgi:hypothetical protein